MKELIFQEKNGSNPMCEFENYEEAVRHYLPQVVKLDSKDLLPSEVRASYNIQAPKLRSSNQTGFTENINPNQGKASQKKSPLRGGPKVQFSSGVNYQRELQEKDQMIEKLYDDNKELHTKVERLQGERGETMKKFDDNEKYWKAKYSKLEKENQQLFDLQK